MTRYSYSFIKKIAKSQVNITDGLWDLNAGPGSQSNPRGICGRETGMRQGFLSSLRFHSVQQSINASYSAITITENATGTISGHVITISVLSCGLQVLCRTWPDSQLRSRHTGEETHDIKVKTANSMLLDLSWKVAISRFHRIRRFITAQARQWTLSWGSWIQYAPIHFLSLRCRPIILSLSKEIRPSFRFLIKIVRVFLIFSMRATCLALQILPGSIALRVKTNRTIISTCAVWGTYVSDRRFESSLEHQSVKV
jgi:hypothetical protein